nr:SLATT domain-containing protein [uncultured Pseudacidovorax sp.]
MARTFHEIVDSYYESAKNKCNAHFRVAERHKRNHRHLGIAATSFSALVGTAVVSSLVQDKPETWLQITATLMSITAVVLTALQTFLDDAGLAAQHKSAAAGYESIKRALDFVSMKYPDAKGHVEEPGTAELESIRATLDDLVKQSPSIPDKDYDAVAQGRKNKL